MRKLLWAVVVIVLLVVIFLLASPVFYGKQAQFFINKAVANANQNYSRYGVVTAVGSYERHWYSSNAVIEVSITNPKVKQWYKQHVNSSFDLQKPLVYQEVLTILHGPVMYHALRTNPFSAACINAYVVLPADLQQRLQLTAPLLSFDGSISYTGVFKGDVVMPAFTYDSPGVKVKFKGLSFFGSMSSDLAHFKGHYTIRPLSVDVNDTDNAEDASHVKVLVSFTQGHFDFKRTPMGLWIGYSQHSIQQEKVILTTWEKQAAQRFTLVYNNITTNLKLDLKGDDYSLDNRVTMGSYQPFSKLIVKNIKADLELDNLNAPVASKLQELLLQSLSSGGGESMLLDLNQLRTLLPELITSKTLVKLNYLSFDLPKGSVMANAQFSWPGYEANMPLVSMGLITNAAVNVSVGKALVDDSIAQAHKRAQEQAAKEKAAEEQASVKPAIPAMEPGPVILPPDTQNSGESTAVMKKQPTQKTVSKPAQSGMSSYVGEANQAGELLQFWLAQGYVIEKDNTYQTAINYTAGRLLVNGKEIKL